MCGIAGIFTVERPVDAALVASVLRMLDRQTHRGPDDWGILVPDEALEDDQIRSLLESRGMEHVRTYPGSVKAPAAVLGSRRLSIIDLSSRGRMPLGSRDERAWITYNGEIYNYRELRDELKRLGHDFRTDTDTETILAGYREWGDGVVDRLRGMFAFAALDTGAAEGPALFLARDRFGIKPLYWARRNGLFLFGSEVRALMASGLVPAEPELRAINGFMVFGSVPSPLTTYRAVHSLPAATTLSMDMVRFSYPAPKRYWSMPRPGTVTAGAEEAAREVRRRLDEAVRSHLISDVPLGVFLSGGMDSSAIVALAARHVGQPLQTLCITFDDPRYSEAGYAEAAAQRFGCRHRTVTLDAEDFAREVPNVLAAMDQPSVDGVNTYFIAKAAREAGLTVVLSGLGGDEVFWGYPGHGSVGRIAGLSRLPGARLAAGGLARLARLLGRGRWEKLEFLRSGGALAAYLAIRGLFPPRDAARLLGIHELPIYAPGIVGCADGSDYAELEFSLYLQNQLLRDTDVFGMCHSIEVRVPFLDHELVEYVAGLPVEVKASRVGGKPLLAAALREELSAETVKRPKMGFTFPFQEWIRDKAAAIRAAEGEKPPLDETESRRVWTAYSSGRMHWSRPWAATVLSRMVKHGTTPDWRSGDRPPERMLFLMPEVYSAKGGIPVYCQDLLRGASEVFREADLHVVSLNDRELPGIADVYGRIHFKGCGPRGRPLQKVSAVLACLRRAVTLRPRTIVCGHINQVPLAWGLSLMTGAECILLAYGIEAWNPPTLLRRVARRCSRVVAISRYTADRMVEWGIRRDSIRILPNAVDGDAFRPLRRTSNGSSFTLATVTRLAASERYKGVDAVIGALGGLAERYPELRYVVGGKGDDLPRLRGVAESCGVAERVSFRGFVPDEELPRFYSEADLFVMPSRKEGFGFVFLEALACGVPVIAGNRDGSMDAVLDGKIGYLVDPSQPDALVKSIELILGNHDNEEPRRDPHFLRREVLAHYGFDRFKERLVAAIGRNGIPAVSDRE
jgi:asparagine synthase (glutamine-hydrolysing)